MGSLFGNLTIFDYYYVVGRYNCREAVSNYNHCLLTCFYQLIQSLLHKVLTLGIKSRGSLVKEKHFRFSN